MKRIRTTKKLSRYGIFSEREHPDIYDPDTEARKARLEAITKRIRQEDPRLRKKLEKPK